MIYPRGVAEQKHAGSFQLCTFLSLTMLFTTAFFQIRYAIFQITDFNYLGYLDGDLIYQVERFLVNMGYPGVKEISSSLADYGSEFDLLTPIFRIVAFILPGHGPLQAYYFLFLVHLCCGLLAVGLLWRMLQRRFWQPPGATLFVALCLSSNFFVNNISFLKPDPNVVLLSLVLSLWLLDRFLEDKNIVWLLSSLAFAGLGAAIKWWGVFMVFPAAFALGYVKDPAVRRSTTVLLPISLGLACLAGLLVYLANPKAVPLTDYLLHAVLDNPAEFSAEGIRSIINQTTDLVFPLNSHILILIGTFCLASASLVLTLWRCKAFFEQRLRQGGFGSSLINLSVSGLTLFFFFLLFDASFLTSNIFFFSFKNYGSHSIIASRSHANSITSLTKLILGNLTGWLQDIFSSGFFSVWIVLGLALSLYSMVVGLKNESIRSRLHCLAWFLGTILGFLFFLVTKKNWATQAMLWPLMLFFIFYASLGLLREMPGQRAVKIACGVFLGLALLQFGQNLLSNPNIFRFYSSHQGVSQEIERINDRLDRIIPVADQGGTLYLVNRDFPLASPARPHCLVKHDTVNLQLRNYVEQASPGDVFVLNVSNITEPIRPVLDGMELLGSISGKRFGREGTVSEQELFRVYRKPAL